MRAEFEIIPSGSDLKKYELIFEVSDSTCSFYLLDRDSAVIDGLVHFRFENMGTNISNTNALSEILKHSLINEYRAITVCYSFPQSILIPKEQFIEDSECSLLDLIYGEESGSCIMRDDILTENLVNIYRIPLSIHELFLTKFPSYKSIHQHTVICRLAKDQVNSFEALVYNNKLIISIRKNGQLQFIKSYKYETPEDATFHLLSTSSYFQISDTPLQISGLIESNSGLYRQIHKYFLSLHLSELSNEINMGEEVKALPAHYFKTLFLIALCV